MSNTTYYDIVTRYGVQDLGSAPLARYRESVYQTDRSLASLAGSSSGLGRVLGGLRFGPAAVGLALVSSAGYVTRSSLAQLNAEMEQTNRLAVRFNAAFLYTRDPIENYSMALGHARVELRELQREAARLPGNLQDHLGIHDRIGGAVFRGRGTAEDVRRLVANLSVAAPLSGGGFPEAAGQTSKILGGRASAHDPLFMALQPYLGLSARSFNAQPAATQLRQFSHALDEVSRNPLLRDQSMRTFGVQISNVRENIDRLFGSEGIGRAFERPYQSIVDSLIRFNQQLEGATPAIVANVDRMFAVFSGMRAAASSMANDWNTGGPGEFLPRYPFLMGWALDPKERKKFTSFIERYSGIDLLGGSLGRARDAFRQGFDLEQRRAYTEQLMFGDDESTKFSPQTRLLPEVNQHITVYVDLKSDTNPEAIALRLVRGIEKAGRAPTVSRRALGFGPES